jgi:RHS repeat-associated protein
MRLLYKENFKKEFMVKQTIKKNVISCIILVCLGIASICAQDVNTIRIPIKNNTPLGVGNTLSHNIPTGTGYTDTYVKILGSLGVDHSKINTVPFNYKLNAIIDVKSYNALNVQIGAVQRLTFTIEYFKDLSKDAYIDIKYLVKQNVYKLDMTIASMTQSTNGSAAVAVTTAPINAYLELRTELIRNYNFTSTARAFNAPKPSDDIDDDLDTKTDAFNISWASLNSDLYYEFEYAFINDYGFKYDAVTGNFVTFDKTKTDLEFNFKRNSTRLIIPNNATLLPSVRINNIAQKGYLVYRVRAVGIDIAALNKIQFGPWNTISESGLLSALPALNIKQITTTHESNKNWQYTSVFAEEAKQKEIINYADGALKSKQTQTRQNSNKDLIVDETIYDYLGRPAVKPLPAPADSAKYLNFAGTKGIVPFKYKYNFNANGAGAQYSAADFDKDVVTLGNGSLPVPAALAPIMLNTSGASRYYSANNPYNSQKRPNTEYVPNASQKPFSQVEYVGDESGRVKRQGGVGPDHQLNTTHETKYMYGSPTQSELDRFFAADAGDAAHYKKEVTIDPNGQGSVAYKDMADRIVATSLIGPKAANLDEVLGGTGPKTFTDDLLNKRNGISRSNTFLPTENALFLSKQIIVPENSPYTFVYDIVFDTILPNCGGSLCFKCVYDLKLSLLNEYGVEQLPASFNNKAIGQFTTLPNGNIELSSVCNSSANVTPGFNQALTLTPGTYTLQKRLTLRQDAIDFYTKAYFDGLSSDETSCIKDSVSFINEEYERLDTLDCYTKALTCNECVQALGDRDLFILNGVGTAAQFDYLVKQCRQPCDTTFNESSVMGIVSASILEADITPHGQYGDFDYVGSVANASAYPLSIYNINNRLPRFKDPNNPYPGKALWKLPLIIENGQQIKKYLDDDGSESHILLLKNPQGQYNLQVDFPAADIFIDNTTGDEYTLPDRLSNVSDFIKLWRPSWAKSLIYYHPEYAYYYIGQEFDKTSGGYKHSSNSFDELLQNTKTFNDAVTKGLILSPTIPGYSTLSPMAKVNDFFSTANTEHDPFVTSPIKPYLAADLLNKYLNFQNLNGVPLDMVSAASYSARCNANVPNIPACTKFGIEIFPGTTNPLEKAFNDSIKNQEWNTFKGFYLGEKLGLKFRYINKTALNIDQNGNGIYGCNVCIENQNFDAFASGIKDPYAISGTPDEDSLQPCNNLAYALYTFKKKRFVDPFNNGLISMDTLELDGSVLPQSIQSIQNQANYQTYLQTGKCPFGSTLEQIINKGFYTNQFNGTPGPILNVQNWNEYDLDFYNHVDNTGSVLKSNQHDMVISYPSNPTPKMRLEFKLGANLKKYVELTVNPVLLGTTYTVNWTNIRAFKKFKFVSPSVTAGTNTTYNFIALAQLFPLGAGVGSSVWLQVTGSTDIQVGNCKFNPVCKPNDFTKDLGALMSVLLQKGQLYSTSNVPLYTVVSPTNASVFYYRKYLTSNIMALYTKPITSMQWKYVPAVVGSAERFELFDLNNVSTPENTLKITLDKSNPVLLPSNFTNLVTKLAYLKPEFQNSFTMTALDANNTQLADINYSLVMNRPANVKEQIETGACNLPTPFGCNSKEDVVREDLQNLLNEIFYKKNATPNIPIKKYLSFSNLLKTYIPSGYWNSPFVKNIVGPASAFSDQYYLQTGVSNQSGTSYIPGLYDINIEFRQKTFTGAIKPYNLSNVIKIEQVIGFGSTSNTFYKFGAITYFIDNTGQLIKDTIFGQIPFPIRNCYACDDPKNLRYTFHGYPVGAASEEVDPSLNRSISTNPEILNENEALYELYKNQYRMAALQKGAYGLEQDNNFMSLAKFSKRYKRSGTGEAFSESKELSSTEKSIYQQKLDLDFVQTIIKSSFPDYVQANNGNAFEVMSSGASKIMNSTNTFDPNCLTKYYRYTNAYNAAFSYFCQNCNTGTNCNQSNFNVSNTEFAQSLTYQAFQDLNLCCFENEAYINNWITVHNTAYGTLPITQTNPTPPPPIKTPANCDVPFRCISTIPTYLLAAHQKGDNCNKYIYPLVNQGGSCTNDSTALGNCSSSYSLYLNMVNQYNLSPHSISNGGFQLSTTLFPSYTQFMQAGMCTCINAYITYLNDFLDPDTYMNQSGIPDAINAFSACPIVNNYPIYSTNCTTEYTDYTNAVTSYNGNHPAGTPAILANNIITATTFYANNYCACVYNYVSFLNAVKLGYITDAAEITFGLNFDNTCKLLQLSPCVPYTVDDTLSPLNPNAMDTTNPCKTIKKYMAVYNGIKRYRSYADSIAFYFKSKYIRKCLKPNETFNMTYPNNTNVTTLYYYDQAGNLIRTIPPEGVEILDIDNTTAGGVALRNQIETDRTTGNRTVFTKHRLASKYYYNSLNQLTSQIVPDHDKAINTDLTGVFGMDTTAQINDVQFDNSAGVGLAAVTQTYQFLTGSTTNTATRGLVYSSTDRGYNWNKVPEALAANIKKVQMFNNLIGFAVGTNSTLLRTMDGGNNWDQIPLYHMAQCDFYDLAIKSATELILVGDNGTMVYVQNANVADPFTTVAPVFTPLKIGGLTLITSADTISAVTYEPISTKFYVTVNNNFKGRLYEFKLTVSASAVTANNLAERTFAALDIIDICYTSDFSSYAIDVHGNLFRSENGGYNTSEWKIWNAVRAKFRQIQFTTKNVGIARVETVNASGNTEFQIWETHDGALTWTNITPAGESFSSVFFDQPEVGLAYSDNLSTLTRKLYNIYIDSANVQMLEVPLPATITSASPIQALWYGKSDNGANNLSKAMAIAEGNNVHFTFDCNNSNPTWLTYYGSVAFMKLAGSVWSDPINVPAVLPSKAAIFALDNAGMLNEIRFDESTIVSGDPNNLTIQANLNNGNTYLDIADFGGVVLALSTNSTSEVDVFGSNYSNLPSVLATKVDNNITITNTSKIKTTTNRVAIYNSNDYSAFVASSFKNGFFLGFTKTAADDIMYPKQLNDVEAYTSSANMHYLFAAGDNGVLFQSSINSGTAVHVPKLAYALGTTNHLNVVKAYSALNASSVLLDSVIVGGDNGTLFKYGLFANACTSPSGCGAHYAVSGGPGLKITDMAINAGKGMFSTVNGGIFAFADIKNNFVSNVFYDAASTRDVFGIAAVKNAANDFIAVGNKSTVWYGNLGAFSQTLNLFLPPLKAVHFNANGIGYLVGDRHTMRRFDGIGANWDMVKPLSTANYAAAQVLNDVFIYNDNEAYLAGNGANYLRRIVGNRLVNTTPTTLFTFSGITAANVNCIYASSKDSVFIGTLNGTTPAMYWAYNAGVASNIPTWTLQALPATVKELYAIRGSYNNKVMWVAGKDRYVAYGLRTGAAYAYTAVTLPIAATATTLFPLRNIEFLNNELGLISGERGTLYKIEAEYIDGTTPTYSQVTIPIFTKLLNTTDTTKAFLNAASFSSQNLIFTGGRYVNGAVTTIFAEVIKQNTLPSSQTFYYDLLGRMVASQNSRQLSFSPRIRYSYTLYDVLGRITEVGEKEENTTAANRRFKSVFGRMYNGFYLSGVVNNDKLKLWVDNLDASGGWRYNVSKTNYDKNTLGLTGFTNATDFSQLRNRVASTLYFDVINATTNVTTGYAFASHYGYDIHGNVKKLVQDFGVDHYRDQRYKTIDYDYDLISGKVNKVFYQKGQKDQNVHKYLYDADNRILEAQTSKDGFVFERDAKYIYYPHGPLSRVEYGRNSVQGTDYAYTIHGWIKGINSNALQSTLDMGKDNAATGLNTPFARDAFAYSLGYYDGDYAPVKGTTFVANTSTAYFNTAASNMKFPLYNGNISHMVSSLYSGTQITGSITNPALFNAAAVMAQVFKYDQLNRIAKMRTYNNFNAATGVWGTTAYTSSADARKYHMNFNYDRNGNILQLNRYKEDGAVLDSLNYNYYTKSGTSKLLQNRLYHYSDIAGQVIPNTDLGNTTTTFVNGSTYELLNGATSANNYRYDKIGNLIKDTKEGITSIVWNVAGKIERINYAAKSIVYEYDAQGMRVAKHNIPTATGLISTSTNTTYYVRDAQGNVMATYNTNRVAPDGGVATGGFYNLTERHLYGSGRLGTDNRVVKLYKLTPVPTAYLLPIGEAAVDTFSSVIGKKYYEGSNHLGNVMAVFTDRRLLLDANANNLADDHRLPHIVSTSDYYAFGMPMTARSYNASNYRYGFNGKENDNEVKGQGNQQDYGMRIYDPRLARFLSLDPLAKSFANLTPYQFASNSPIANIDLDGLESLYFQITHDKKTGKAEIKLADIKTSYLDKLLPYHVSVSIDGGDYLYAGDYALSFDGQRKALASDLADYAKNPEAAVTKMSAAKEQSIKDADDIKQFWHNDLWVNAATIAWASNVGKGTYSVPKYKNVNDAIGENEYSPIASQSHTVKNKVFLNILANVEKNGDWAKVYEAGYIGQKKVEIHYFVNKKTGSIVDAKIKQDGKWSNTNFGKKAKENAVTEEKK